MAKATSKSNPVKSVPEGVKEVKKEGKKVAKQAVYSPLMENLMRLGYAVKGFLYVAIGFIAIAGALGKSSTPADQIGAIVAFSKLPYASLLLWVILVGLVSYSLWGVVRAVFDPLHKGNDLKGLLTRGGFLLSAITYATFVIPTYHLIQGAGGGAGSDATVTMVSAVMDMPLGRWLIGAVGLGGIAAGLYQIYMGITMNFDQFYKPYALSSEQFKVAKQMGRYGTMARGVVFALVGGFLVLAAYQANPGNARGFDGAFKFLERQPYGIWILGIIAVGLIAFGLYSFMSAAWLRLKR
jgi:uncharacterized protein DUF1206